VAAIAREAPVERTGPGQIQRRLPGVRRFETPSGRWSSAGLRPRRGISRDLVRETLGLVQRDGLEESTLGRRITERPKRGEGFARRHLLGRAFGAPLSRAAVAVPKADLGRVLAPMTRARGAADLVLWRGQKALLRDLLQAALVVVIGPGLHVDQAVTKEAVGRPVPLVEKDRANDGLEGIGEDRLQRTSPGLVRALAQQQVVAEAEARGEARQAFRIDDRGAQAGQLAFVGGRIRVVEMLGRDQLEHGITQVLEALVVRAAPF